MDPAFRPDMVAMIAASSALSISGAPFDGPVAGLCVGRVNGEFKAFLTPEEREQSDLDLVVAGIESGVVMVEAGANEVDEEVVIEAIAWAHEAMQPAIKLQRELAGAVAKEQLEYELVLPNEEIQATVDAWAHEKFGEKATKAIPRAQRNGQ